jgi:predicted Zn finger-like uncharacterized protein
MDIRCGSCSKLFRVADEKISGKGIRFKCSKCGEIITVTMQDLEMDLFAREGEAAPATSAPPADARPHPAPAAPPAAPPAAEPEAREYKPPPSPEDEQEPAAREYRPPEPPAAGLEDFDFSSPDVAAQQQQEQQGDAGPGEFSLGEMPSDERQEAGGEVSLSEEDARAAEDAFSFPVDLISEPRRKSAFASEGSTEASGQEQESMSVTPGEQEPSHPSPDTGAASLAVPDLGEPGEPAAPGGPGPGAAPEAAAETPAPPQAVEEAPTPKQEPVPPKGPVISPDLLAQMKKASASRAAAKQEPPPAAASDEIDLGAALAIPKGAGAAAARVAAPVTTGAAAGSGKRVLILAVVAVALVAVLGALYALYTFGYLLGRSGQTASQPLQAAGTFVSPEGLSIEDPYAYRDPQNGDLVITGSIRSALTTTKQGWYLEIGVTDQQQKIVATVRMVSGAQLHSKRDLEVLARRGINIDELRTAAAPKARTAVVPPRGSVAFEARLPEPPAGAAGFLPVLKTYDPASVFGAAE